MLEVLNSRSRTGLAVIAALALSGASLAQAQSPAPAGEAGSLATARQSPVPDSEAGRFSPERLRGLLSGPVQVTERKAGRFRGNLLVRRFGEDGRWTGCAIGRSGKAGLQTGDWSVAADSRGRGKLFAVADRARPENRLRVNPTVIHYDPGAGRLLWRFRPVKGKAWLDWNEGWFQSAWPQIAVDKCPDLDLGGAAVDERQRGATLEELRRQTPDAPLKGLVGSLPSGGDPTRAAAPAARSPEQQLSDKLVGGGDPLTLPWMGAGYEDRRFVFVGGGHVSVVDMDGKLARGEGFDGNWRWSKGRLEVRVSGDDRVHDIAWQDLARDLGVTLTLRTAGAPDAH